MCAQYPTYECTLDCCLSCKLERLYSSKIHRMVHPDRLRTGWSSNQRYPIHKCMFNFFCLATRLTLGEVPFHLDYSNQPFEPFCFFPTIIPITGVQCQLWERSCQLWGRLGYRYHTHFRVRILSTKFINSKILGILTIYRPLPGRGSFHRVFQSKRR